MFSIAFFLAVAGSIIGFGISGLYYSTNMNEEYMELKCSLKLFVDEVLYGVKGKFDSTWKGIATVKNSLSETLDEVTSIDVEGINSAATDIDFITFEDNGKYTHSKSFTNDLPFHFRADDYENMVTNPEGTDKLELDLLKDDNVLTSPLYQPLHAECIRFESGIYPAMKNLNRGTDKLLDPEVMKTAREGVDKLGKIRLEAENFKGKINDYTDKGDGIIKIIQLSITIYYATIIGCSGIAVIGSVFLVSCGCNGWVYVSNFGCFFLTFLMMLGFVTAAVLMPLSVIIIEACDLIKLERLGERQDVIPEDIWKEIEVCLIGDGNMYKSMNLGESLGFAEEALEGLTLIEEVYDTDNEGDDCPVKYDLEGYLENLRDIRDKYPEKACESAFTTHSIEDLTGKCKNDYIVWRDDECPSDVDVVNSNNAGSLGDYACFAITSLSSDCEQAVNDRYEFCPIKDEIMRYCKYAKEVNAILNRFIDAVGDKNTYGTFLYLLNNDNKQGKVCDIVKATGELNDEAAILRRGLSSLSSDLSGDLNCIFIGDALNRIYNATCRGLLKNIPFIAIFVGVISALSFLSASFLICVNRSFYRRRIDECEKIKDRSI